VSTPTLIEIVARTLSIDPRAVSEASTSANTRNWDSLRQVILMTELERIYGIEFEFDQINEAQSILRIRDILREKGIEIS